jgi:glucose-6-phosphate isomerase
MAGCRAHESAMNITELDSRDSWKAVVTHHARLGELHLREMFAADPERGPRFTLEAAGLYLDYSKNRIDAATLKSLVALAVDCGLPARTAAMFRQSG